MDKIVFVLCTFTCLSCALLLLRGYLKTRTRFLLWSCACFALLTLSNGLLYMDKFVTPVDLSLFRSGVTFGAVAVLLYGLIWETC